MEESKEKCIGKIIHSLIPIEWMRYNMYIEADRYRNIPMLVFRVEESCPEDLLEKLKNCVEAFQGTVKWKLFKDPLSRKGNYLLTVSELENMRKKYQENRNLYNEKEYLGVEAFKTYCECAIQDIPFLAEYIKKM